MVHEQRITLRNEPTYHNERDDDIDTGYDDTDDNTAIDLYGGDDVGRSINVRDDLSNNGYRVCVTIWGGNCNISFRLVFDYNPRLCMRTELGDQWIALVLERVQGVEKVLRAI